MTKDFKAFKAEIAEKAKVTLWVPQDPFVYVEINLLWDDARLTSCGFAKRNPLDEANSELGFEIAHGRAIHKMAKRLYRQTRGGLAIMGPLAA